MLKKYGGPDPTDVHSFEHHWPNILPIIKRLIHHEPINKQEWQNLFYDVHMICSWDEKGCHKLLKGLEAEFDKLFISATKARLLSIDDGQQQLKEYVDCWLDFTNHCHRFPVAFQQLDLAAKNNQPRKILVERFTGSVVRLLILDLWNRNLVQLFGRRLQDKAMDLILAERNGLIIDSRLITGLLESFMYFDHFQVAAKEELQRICLLDFEATYLKEMELFYLPRASEKLSRDGALPYIFWATKHLEREERRAESYLDFNKDAIKKANETCTNILVANFVDQIILESTTKEIRANNTENMKTIFLFLDRVAGCADKFLHEFGKHIVTTGLGNLEASSSSVSSNCEKFVDKLIECYKQFSSVVKISFHDDQRAKSTLEKSLESIINDTRVFQFTDDQISSNLTSPISAKQPSKNVQLETRCPELIASYCDILLKRALLTKKFSSDDISERLDEMILIIKYLKNKDAFIKYHKAYLTRRLILNSTISEKEEQFVDRLRTLPAMPIEEVTKLLRMFKDLKSSESLQMQYKKSLPMTSNLQNLNNNTIESLTSRMATLSPVQDNNNKIPSVQSHDTCNFKILNPSAWVNSRERLDIKLPDEITSMMQSFETFYTNMHQGRKLEWCHQLSNGTITFQSNNGKYDIDITAAQLSVLSAFNEDPKEQKQAKELEQASNLSRNDLKRTLWSLISNPKLKVQLMNCVPQLSNYKDLDQDTNRYSINYEFVIIKNGKPQPKGRVSLIGRLQI